MLKQIRTYTLSMIVVLLIASIFGGTAQAKQSKLKSYLYRYDAQLMITKYPSVKIASQRISFHKYSNTDGQPVYLGHGITGYSDAGAGTQGIQWNEGRWTIQVLSSNLDNYDNPPEGLQPDSGLKLAKKVVAYLDKHRLPAPNRYGTISIYADGRTNFIRWQKGSKIYQLLNYDNSLGLIKTATLFR